MNTNVTPIKRVAVRFTAASRYRADCRRAPQNDSPKTMLAAVASQRPDIKVSHLSGGKWWSETIQNKTLLHTVIQLPESIADKLVQRSGEEGIFACQLGAPRTDKRIEWFPRHGKESDEAYHRRLFATAPARKAGFKYRKGGSCDLGLFGRS